MDENRNSKRFFDIKAILLILLAVLIVICFVKIQNMKDNTDALKRQLSNLSSELRNTQMQISSIYQNVDNKLKEQASLLSGLDFSLGELGENHKVELILRVTPKEISEDMALSVSIDGKSYDFRKEGSTFVTHAEVGLFLDYESYPLLSITQNGITKTEYLDSLYISRLHEKYLPSVYGGMSGASSLSNGKLSIDLNFTIDTVKPSSDVIFKSFSLVEMINGEEISRTDITKEVEKADGSYHENYFKKFELSKSDTLEIFFIAEDSLGYLHKITAHCRFDPSEGNTDISFPAFTFEQIYDQEENLLTPHY